MSAEQTFLVRKGIHNFVSVDHEKGQCLFLIRRSEREAMISHARSLIQNGYGEQALIRLV